MRHYERNGVQHVDCEVSAVFRHIRAYGVIALTLLGTLFLAAIVEAATDQDPDLGRCGAYTAGNQVSGVYTIPSADRIWELFPAMGLAPELAGEDGETKVVIFDGQYTAEWTNDDGSQAVVNDVVCVLTPSGQKHIYYGVSREGFNAP